MTNTKARLVRAFLFLLALLALPSSAVMVMQGGPRHYKAAVAGNVEPSNFALELVAPRQVGTAPSAESGTPTIPSGHRLFKAYPGLEYNIRAVVIGGSYPYTCSLSGSVAWLAVDAATCVISGTAPNDANGTQYTPTLTVTDDENTVRSEPWTITITTAGFKFVDSVNDGSGDTGTISAPYDTFAQMKSGAVAGDIVYFRTGTYDTGSIAYDDDGGYLSYNNPNGNWRRLNFSFAQWLAYPGETPIIDGGYVQNVEQGNLLRVGGNTTYPTYIDGLEFRNYYHMVLQLGALEHYVVFRRLNIHDIKNSFDGANSAAIDSTRMDGIVPRYYVAYQDNNIHDGFAGSMKMYWQYKSLQADNTFANNGGLGLDTGADAFAGGPDHKAVTGRLEVRANVYTNCPSSATVPDSNGAVADAGFGGNQDARPDADVPGAYSIQQASGEVRWNKFGCASRPGLRVLNLNNFSSTGTVYVYRNTGIGRWNVENSDGNGVDTGPWVFKDNIIINDVGAGSTDRITFGGGTPGNGGDVTYGAGDDANLAYDTTTGASVVDSNLNLVGSYRTQWLGKKGAELQ